MDQTIPLNNEQNLLTALILLVLVYSKIQLFLYSHTALLSPVSSPCFNIDTQQVTKQLNVIAANTCQFAETLGDIQYCIESVSAYLRQLPTDKHDLWRDDRQPLSCSWLQSRQTATPPMSINNTTVNKQQKTTENNSVLLQSIKIRQFASHENRILTNFHKTFTT